MKQRLTICVPKNLCEVFQKCCNENNKTMSEVVRNLIENYIDIVSKQKPRVEVDWGLQKAASAWCQEKTKSKVMDCDLAIEFAKIINSVVEEIIESKIEKINASNKI